MLKSNGQISIWFAGDIYAPWRRNCSILGELSDLYCHVEAAIFLSTQEICFESSKKCTKQIHALQRIKPSNSLWLYLILWTHGLACSDTVQTVNPTGAVLRSENILILFILFNSHTTGFIFVVFFSDSYAFNGPSLAIHHCSLTRQWRSVFSSSQLFSQ